MRASKVRQLLIVVINAFYCINKYAHRVVIFAELSKLRVRHE